MSEQQSHEEQFQTSRRERRRSAKKGGGGFLEFLIILVVAFALVFGFVRPFVVEAFWIPSESMVPTLEVGDRVLVNKFIYRFTEPDRGDIVVFESVDGDGTDLIKRVIALPGDTVAVRDGTLFVNGEPQREPYLNRALPDSSFYAPTEVPEGHVFVMGDNRTNSADSRVFGPLPKENIAGEAFLRFWPPGRIGLI
ncbi:MAG: signal peptidase I [Actinomycetota bacterium]|nr:signal peptidase I [Actinomycetota bacterium]